METKNKKNILIADDSVFFRLKISDILTQAGHRVIEVKDGQEVIDEIKNNSNDINMLLLDMQMPKVDGFGVVDWLNKNKDYFRFPVAAISGTYDAKTVKERLHGKGVSVVISKDFTPDQLIFHINEILFKEMGASRDYPRVPAAIPVDFTCQGKTFSGFILSLSLSGAFIHSKGEVSTNAEVSIKCKLNNKHDIITLCGKVTRKTEHKSGNALFEGFGIRFEDINDSDKKALNEFVEEGLKEVQWYRDL